MVCASEQMAFRVAEEAKQRDSDGGEGNTYKRCRCAATHIACDTMMPAWFYVDVIVIASRHCRHRITYSKCALPKLNLCSNSHFT